MGVTTKVKELKESMIGAINNAQLPACIVLLVMDSLANELRVQESMQLKLEEDANRQSDGEHVES